MGGYVGSAPAGYDSSPGSNPDISQNTKWPMEWPTHSIARQKIYKKKFHSISVYLLLLLTKRKHPGKLSQVHFIN
jgi:hypothetical protein